MQILTEMIGPVLKNMITALSRPLGALLPLFLLLLLHHPLFVLKYGGLYSVEDFRATLAVYLFIQKDE